MKIDQHVKASRTLPLIRKTAVATLVSSVFVLASGGVAVAAERVIDVDTSGENGTQGGVALVTGIGNKVTVESGITFSKNTAESVGGVFSIVDTKDGLDVKDGVTFDGNTSGTQGGALHNQRAEGTKLGNNITFQNNTAKGYGGGAIYQDTDGAATSISIGSGAKFINNKTESSHGGAIMNFSGGTGATLEIGANAEFRDNSAEKNGGAISNWSGDITVQNGAVFDGNTAKGNGGAISSYYYNDGQAGKVQVGDNAQYTNNEAAQGGAIASLGSVVSVGTDAYFESNKATHNGGALFVKSEAGNAGTASIGTGAQFMKNEAQVGGAISVVDTKNGLNVGDNAVFDGNVSRDQGGAIHNQRAEGTKLGNNITFQNNIAKGYGGGAIYQDTDGAATSITIGSGAKFINNKTESSHGGAIMNFSSGTGAKIDIGTNAQFIGNSAAKNGGAVSNWAGEMTVASGAVFEGNTAEGNGGAVYSDDYGAQASMTFDSVTFSGNSAGGEGGAIYNDATLTLTGDNNFFDNTANGEANDIQNEGTLKVTEGTTNLDSGIVSNGSLTVTNATLGLGDTSYIATLTGSEATLALDTTDFEVVDNQIDGLALTTTGSVNDALNGDVDALKSKIGGETGSVGTVRMAEGEVVGEVLDDGKGNRTEKVNVQNEEVAHLLTNLPAMTARIEMNDLRKRMGDLRSIQGASGVWARYDGGKMSGMGIENQFNKIQVGADTTVFSDSVRLGMAFSYSNGDVDGQRTEADVDSYSLAGYGVWLGDKGQFADVIFRVAQFDTDLSARTYDADLSQLGVSLSGEFGWRFDLSNLVYVEPSVEATYTWIDGDTFSGSSADYELDSTNSFIGKIGFATGLKCPNNRGDVYFRVHAAHEFAGDSDFYANLGSTSRTISFDGQDTWVEYAVGANFNVTPNAYVYADVERTSGADIDEDWRANIGFRYAF